VVCDITMTSSKGVCRDCKEKRYIVGGTTSTTSTGLCADCWLESYAVPGVWAEGKSFLYGTGKGMD